MITSFRVVLASMAAGLLLMSCSILPRTPLSKALAQVRLGMTEAQVESILGPFRSGPVGTGTEAGTDTGNPMGGLEPGVITYPLWDKESTASFSGQRYYRYLSSSGEWEYGNVEFEAGKVVSVRQLK